jgi:hypothetical protein
MIVSFWTTIGLPILFSYSRHHSIRIRRLSGVLAVGGGMRPESPAKSRYRGVDELSSNLRTTKNTALDSFASSPNSYSH